MKNFYIVYNPDKDEDNRITSELTVYIESQNGACKAMDCYSFSACDKQQVTDELESFDWEGDRPLQLPYDLFLEGMEHSSMWHPVPAMWRFLCSG